MGPFKIFKKLNTQQKIQIETFYFFEIENLSLTFFFIGFFKHFLVFEDKV